MRFLIVSVSLLITSFCLGQYPLSYSVNNAHSHNDYEQSIPFKMAYDAGFGSIEVDIFLVEGELYAAHSVDQLALKKSLANLYLQPLNNLVQQNGGNPYKNPVKPLQMLIDIKNTPQATLAAFIKLLQNYPALITGKNISWVITGEQPPVESWRSYPTYITFDAKADKIYADAVANKIGLYSSSLQSFTRWNGKSNIGANDLAALQAVVNRIHALNKKIRFWGAPDFVNAWYQLMHLGVDYINTDHIYELSSFFNKLPANNYVGTTFYQTEALKNAPTTKPVKNVILFIGDGCGLAQLYAGFTANKGALNIFNMSNSGLSKTNSFDAYITDSAPGSTAFSTGHKTCNRFVGVDHAGNALKLLPEYLSEKNIKSAIITSGDITDATPADFYAHNISRDDSYNILSNLTTSPVSLLAGSGISNMDDALTAKLKQQGFTITATIDAVNNNHKKWIVMDDVAAKYVSEGRGNWLSKAFHKSLNVLNNNPAGFFMMVEGAKIDHAGHANHLPNVVQEVLDFDKVVGEALRFADSNNETLVIVLADHETGGLSLLDGDLKSVHISGNFSTNDHTAIPIPVFAYGPGAQAFNGFYENVEVFEKILNAFRIKINKK